ncbi:hypothetical protein FACS1894152_4960 [Bacilli bacterium]|nr:hypothetical protein FACS1894152_4960 [Bacilli bacterium]
MVWSPHPNSTGRRLKFTNMSNDRNILEGTGKEWKDSSGGKDSHVGKDFHMVKDSHVGKDSSGDKDSQILNTISRILMEAMVRRKKRDREIEKERKVEEEKETNINMDMDIEKEKERKDEEKNNDGKINVNDSRGKPPAMAELSRFNVTCEKASPVLDFKDFIEYNDVREEL